MENEKPKTEHSLLHRLDGVGHMPINIPDRRLFVVKGTSDSDKLYWSYNRQDGDGKHDAAKEVSLIDTRLS